MLILAIFFIAGAAAGFYLSARVDESSARYLYMAGTGGAGQVSFARALQNSFLFPAIVFVLGFTVFGVLCVPLAVAARACMLSFTISAFCRCFGFSGLAFAAAAIGGQALLSLPCLFLLSSQSMVSSLAVTRVFVGKPKGSRGFYGKNSFVRAFLCAAALMVAAVFETYAVPLFIGYVKL